MSDRKMTIAVVVTWALALIMIGLLMYDQQHVVDETDCIVTDDPDKLREFQRACFQTEHGGIVLSEFHDEHGARYWRMTCEQRPSRKEKHNGKVRPQTGRPQYTDGPRRCDP